MKSAFGSRGVVADQVTGDTTNIRAKKLYALLNDKDVRDNVLAGAASRYGYDLSQVHLRFYVGRFAGPTLLSPSKVSSVEANRPPSRPATNRAKSCRSCAVPARSRLTGWRGATSRPPAPHPTTRPAFTRPRYNRNPAVRWAVLGWAAWPEDQTLRLSTGGVSIWPGRDARSGHHPKGGAPGRVVGRGRLIVAAGSPDPSDITQ